jgi:hypothetical protein
LDKGGVQVGSSPDSSNSFKAAAHALRLTGFIKNLDMPQ